MLDSDPMLRSGDVIGGRYRLVAPLAAGGMGAVWRAEHTELGTEVALKVMLAECANTASGEKRFRREAQAAARLQSPHVVRVQDFGVHDGQPYLAMELLRGEDLAARIEARGRILFEECAAILDGVARAVDLAHESGVIHRDLKPANIFLAQDAGEEVVKVLDFGVAKLESSKESSTTTGSSLVGSPAYMSPEQVWGETVTPSSDIWALGVVAFEMATGENPFEGGALARVFERIVRDDLPKAETYIPDVSVRIEAFFERALAREPSGRFESAGALAAGFREAITSEAATAASPATVRRVDPHAKTLAPGAVEAAHRAKRRARWWIGASVAAVCVITLAIARPSSSEGPGPDRSSQATPVASTEPIAPARPTGTTAPHSEEPSEEPPLAAPSTARATPERSSRTQPKASARAPAPSVRPSAPPPVAAPPASSVDPVFGIPERPR